MNSRVYRRQTSRERRCERHAVQKHIAFGIILLLCFSAVQTAYSSDYGIYAETRFGGGPFDSLSFVGAQEEAPNFLANVDMQLGACAAAAVSSQFVFAQSAAHGQILTPQAVADVNCAELNITNDQALVDAALEGSNQFEFLMNFEVAWDVGLEPGSVPNILDDATVQLDVGLTGQGFISSVGGIYSLSNQIGIFDGLPSRAVANVALPGSITVTGAGTTATMCTNVFLQSLSRLNGAASIQLELADIPLTRVDGVSFDDLAIDYEFSPPTFDLSLLDLDGYCGNDTPELINIWDIVRLELNPTVLSFGNNLAAADIFGVGAGGVSTMNLEDFDENGELEVPIGTSFAEATTDGLTIFGRDLDGNLVLSAPEGLIAAGVLFDSLFEAWTVDDALADPVNFMLDPQVQAVLLEQLPPMGSPDSVNVELFSFDRTTGVSSAFGDGELIPVPEPSGMVLASLGVVGFAMVRWRRHSSLGSSRSSRWSDT